MSSILVTDDEQTSRDAIQKVLEREGYDVQAVDSVDKALQKLSTQSFDLVVCDYRMPGKTGIDLLTELAARECHVPVIIVSACADGNTERIIRSLGAVDLLRKSLRRKVLLESAVSAIGSLR
jgi:CheY-like chemotaxis protein